MAGTTATAGSLLFFIGGLMPVTRNVFRTDDSLLRVLQIAEHPGEWDLAMALFGAGGLIAAIGLVLLARSLQTVTGRGIVVAPTYVAATLAALGTVSWVIIGYYRIVRSPYDLVAQDNMPWLFWSYQVFTQTAFIIFGVVLLLSGYPKWLSWLLVVSGTLLWIDLLTVDASPPFVNYAVTLILGVTLLTLRPRTRRETLEPVT